LHPVQLYESGAAFLIFLTLRVMRLKPRFRGKLFWYYLLFYSVARFVIEFYRNDPRGWAIPQFLSTAQAVGLIAVPIAVFMLGWGGGKKSSG